MKKHSLLLVEWSDSSTLRGWQSIDDECHGSATIWSAGYLVKETKTDVTLTTSISQHGHCVDAISIPKHAIINRRTLKYYVEGK